MYWHSLRRLATAAAKTSPAKLQDVVVIGGGPAGLSVLAALKSSPKTRHLKCSLIEGGSLQPVRDFMVEPPENYTNRVVSLTLRSVEFMQERLGSWPHIQIDRVKFYDGVEAWDSQDAKARIGFDNSSLDTNPMAAMCEVINIQSSLLSRIEELNATADPSEQEAVIMDNVKVESIHSEMQDILMENHDLVEIDPTKGKATLDWPVLKLSNGETIQTRLLIGADGYNSPVRKFAGIQSRGWMYNRWGVVGTIKLEDEDFRSLGWQRFLTTGPLAILPLTENNATFVWSSTPELAELLLKVDDQIFPHLLNAAMVLDEVDLNYLYKQLRANPADLSVIDDMKWRRSKFDDEEVATNCPLPAVSILPGSRARFPLRMSHADTYVAPRVALVGDAAHTIHPLAGQGLNMGQSDIAALIEAIEKGVDRGLDIGSTLTLEPYVSKAYPFNHAMLGACDKLHKIFSTDWTPLVVARGLGMKTMNSLGPFKDMIVKMVSSL